MPTKILFATDMHFRSMRPISRTDESFFESQIAKLDYLAEISKNVDVAIFGGDIFDRPDIGPGVIIRVMRSLAKFKCPVKTVIGNHEVYGYEGQSIERSALGVLFEHGCIQRLDFLELPHAHVFGIHAFDKANWQIPTSNSDVKNIVVAHKMITDKPLPGAECLTVEAIAQATNADVVLSGDIHYPHTVESNGKLFINPGSLSRMSIADRDRMPHAVILTVEDDGEIDYELVPVPAKPGHIVFNIADYSAKLSSEAHTKDFVKTYASVVFSVKAEAHKIADVLARFLKENNIPEEMQGMVNVYYKNAETQVLKENREE